MDQIKTGRFIASLRKDKGLTQASLANRLDISDKTVSKWERGAGLPDVSLMLPLCEILEISVNELLTGEKLTDADYKKSAEVTIMSLVQENKENKKRMLQSVMCGIITIIAVCSLTVIASYIEMPVAIRIALIIFAVITAVAGVGTAATLEVKAGYYQCPKCGHRFVPAMKDYVKGYHTLTKRRLTCPECGKTGMCSKHIIVR
ncbi:MAG: helix-turn-helix domain-containing protein [Eubacteriales bacterium]|nr:helix-turn-helix domain-containing protein [Eubacteriales bacterium]